MVSIGSGRANRRVGLGHLPFQVAPVSGDSAAIIATERSGTSLSTGVKRHSRLSPMRLASTSTVGNIGVCRIDECDHGLSFTQRFDNHGCKFHDFDAKAGIDAGNFVIEQP